MVDLVGEGSGHDEAGVAHGTAKVDKTALGQQDDILPVLQGETVNLNKTNDIDDVEIDILSEIGDFDILESYLGLDVGLGPAVLLQPLHLRGNWSKLTHGGIKLQN